MEGPDPPPPPGILGDTMPEPLLSVTAVVPASTATFPAVVPVTPLLTVIVVLAVLTATLLALQLPAKLYRYR